jgi:hypothetical protein
MAKEKKLVEEENLKLKELLRLHGIAYQDLYGSSAPSDFGNAGSGDVTLLGSGSSPSYGLTTAVGRDSSPSHSLSNSNSAVFHQRSVSASQLNFNSFTPSDNTHQHHSIQQFVPPTPNQGLLSQPIQLPTGGPQGSQDTYDQIGIDFVMTYDRTPYLSPPHH